MKFQTLCATILGSASAYSNQKPPLTGKYFYADMSQADYYGMHFVKMKVGSQNQEMNMSLSSNQYMIGVYENTCVQMSNGGECNTPNPYDYSKSTTHVDEYDLVATDARIFGNDQGLLMNRVVGVVYEDTLNFELYHYMRETTLPSMSFVANYQSKLSLTSTFDGYLGLAPYSAKPDLSSHNFVWQLKEKGFIEHMVVAVYAEVQSQTATSSIKFGSWDQHALKDTGSTDITMLRTASLDGWKVSCNSFMINDVSFIPKEENGDAAVRTLEINSHLPFLYLPDDDWNRYAELIKKNYPEVMCSQSENVCYFQNTCDKVNVQDYTLKLGVFDDNDAKMTLEISDSKFFIPGNMLGGNAGLCYVPVFMSGLGLTTEWQVGSAVMKEYYVVYDQTPYNERGEKYNQIGMGIQNNNAEMLVQHYDYSKTNQDAGNFHPSSKASDSSHTIAPAESVYDVKIIPAVLPVPTPVVPVVPVPTPTPAVVPKVVPVVPVPTPTPAVVPIPVVPVIPAKKPTHDPSKFIPKDHSGKAADNAATGAGVKIAPKSKKSDATLVYLISGIGALIFVILVGLCLCRRNRQNKGNLIGLRGQGAPLTKNAYNLNADADGGSMNV